MSLEPDMRKAAQRLHHLSMRYAGALLELVTHQQAGFIPSGHPGLKESRDFIDLILMTRAEINGLTKILLDTGITTPEKLTAAFAEEYEHFAQVKAKFLDVGISDAGLIFKSKPEELN